MKERRNAAWINYVAYNQVSEADAHFCEASAGVKCYRELELDDINSYLENLYVYNQAWDDMFIWEHQDIQSFSLWYSSYKLPVDREHGTGDNVYIIKKKDWKLNNIEQLEADAVYEAFDSADAEKCAKAFESCEKYRIKQELAYEEPRKRNGWNAMPLTIQLDIQWLFLLARMNWSSIWSKRLRLSSLS
jgi:hypothetical protein